MIKSGKIRQLIKEKKDRLFDKFYQLLILILQNFDYFDDLNVTLLFSELNNATSSLKTLDKYLILKLIIGDFKLKEGEYVKLITSYIMHPSLVKVFIADLLNYFSYLQTSQDNMHHIKIVGFCSIFIKFKYYLLKQISSVGLSEKDIDLGKRIGDNIKQFCGLANNSYFIEAIKNEINQKNMINMNKNTNSNNIAGANSIASTNTESKLNKFISFNFLQESL